MRISSLKDIEPLPTTVDKENEVQENVVSPLIRNSKFWLAFALLGWLNMLREIWLSKGKIYCIVLLLFQPRTSLLQSKPPPTFQTENIYEVM